MKKVVVLDRKRHRVLGWYIDFFAISGVCIFREKISRIYCALTVMFMLISSGLFIYALYKFLFDLELFFVVFHHFTLASTVSVGNIYFFIQRKILRRLISGLGESYDYESTMVSRFLDKIQQERLKGMGRAWKTILLIDTCMQVNFIINGFAEWYVGRMEYILEFPFQFPFNLSSLPLHLLAFTWQHIAMELIGFNLYGLMLNMYAVHGHLASQITLLKFAIERSKDRVQEAENIACSFRKELKAEGENILKQSYIRGAKQCVQHHLYIIEYYNDANRFYTIAYSLIFFIAFLLFTLAGFALISDNTYLKVKFVVACVLQLICMYIYFWFGEQLSEMSESICMTVYGIQWYDMPRECQAIFKTMCERARKPLSYCSITGQKVDFENYMAIIKASYSYFNMLYASQYKV